MSKEEIPVEEMEHEEGSGQAAGETWWDEMKVAGEELLGTVKELVGEAGVRRIVIRNRNDRTLIEIPLLAGIAGIALLPTYAALALIAGLVADCSILVERSGPKEPAGE